MLEEKYSDAEFKVFNSWEFKEYERMVNHHNLIEQNWKNSFYSSEQPPLKQKENIDKNVAVLQNKDRKEVKKEAKKFVHQVAKGDPIVHNNEPVAVGDISFSLAEGLQYMYSGENPQSEYHDWVNDQAEIETAVKVDGETREETIEKNNFVSFLNDRETELKLVISLFEIARSNSSGYYKDAAENRLGFLYFKLSELRRLRERTSQAKGYSVEEKEQEKERLAKELEQKSLRMLNRIAINNNGNYDNYEKQFEAGVEGIAPHSRPDTHNIDEAQNKIITLQGNKGKMKRLVELSGRNTGRYAIYYEQDENSNIALRMRRRFVAAEYTRVAREMADNERLYA